MKRNISHDKLVHEFLESLGEEDWERVAKLFHDEWHEGDSTGWADAKSVYGSRLRRIIKNKYQPGLTNLTSANRRILLKLINEALE